MIDIKDALTAANNVALAGMKSGEEIGFRKGMLRAIAICEDNGDMSALDVRKLIGEEYRAHCSAELAKVGT